MHRTGSFGKQHFLFPSKVNCLIKNARIRESRRARSEYDDKCEVANNGRKCDTAIEHNREIYSRRTERVPPIQA